MRGFNLTPTKTKIYKTGSPPLSQFKLEKVMDYGPNIIAAFAVEGGLKEIERLKSVLARLIVAAAGVGGAITPEVRRVLEGTDGQNNHYDGTSGAQTRNTEVDFNTHNGWGDNRGGNKSNAAYNFGSIA